MTTVLTRLYNAASSAVPEITNAAKTVVREGTSLGVSVSIGTADVLKKSALVVGAIGCGVAAYDLWSHAVGRYSTFHQGFCNAVSPTPLLFQILSHAERGSLMCSQIPPLLEDPFQKEITVVCVAIVATSVAYLALQKVEEGLRALKARYGL